MNFNKEEFDWSLFDKIFNKDQKELKVTKIKPIWNCKLCNSRMFYDKNKAMKICQNCGYCYNYQDYSTEDVDWSRYRKKCTNYYYKRDERFEDNLNKCKEMNNDDKKKIIKIFKNNLTIIQKAYYDNEMKSINYNFIINKLMNLCGMEEYLKYYPITRSRSTLKKSEKVWKSIVDKIQV